MNQISQAEVDQIEAALRGGLSLRAIARNMGINRETVLRYKAIFSAKIIPSPVITMPTVEAPRHGSHGTRYPRAGRPKADLPRRAVIAEWDAWALKHVPPGTVPMRADAVQFFDHLRSDRPDLLEFPSDDKWERVHKWLLRVYRVRD